MQQVVEHVPGDLRCTERRNPEKKRMICPYCNNSKCRVIDSRDVGFTRRRRYFCKECGRRFTTTEKVVKNRKGTGYENK